MLNNFVRNAMTSKIEFITHRTKIILEAKSKLFGCLFFNFK